MQLASILRRILSVCEPAWRVLLGSLIFSAFLLLCSFAILVHIGPESHANLRLFRLAYELTQLPVVFLLLAAITSACIEEQFQKK
ncbi:MAG: hypothetical protein ACOX7K_01525 [Oscillospiraceae bacterium]|jgi:hypothetical protein